jgi:copper(I)-binding protein
MIRRCVALLAGTCLAFCAPPLAAQVVLSQTSFEGGVNFAAFFKVPHGCGGSPTLSLRVEIPADVTVLDVPAKEGWMTNAERVGGRVAAVSWRGRLEGGEAGQFGVLLKLPARTGALYFPTVQKCAKAEMRWTQTAGKGNAAQANTGPAPSVQLTAAESRPAMVMAGNLMIMEPWSRATPPGAQTGAGYLTMMNHGTAPDSLLGGSTPVAAKLEIHQTTITSGIVSMRPAADGVPIPGESTVTLKPESGYHLMLIGLKAPLNAGTHIPVTLNFAKAGAVSVDFTVEPLGARSPGAAEHHHQ